MKIFYTYCKIDPIESNSISGSSKVLFKKYYMLLGVPIYRAVKIISKNEFYRWLSNRNK